MSKLIYGSLGRVVVLLSLVLIVLGATTWAWQMNADASSHREAPLIAKDPTVDNTDVYAFRSPDAPSTVTLIANWIPFEEPAGGPNFYHFDDLARYWIKIDRDGDGVEDISYLFEFKTQIQNPNTFLYNTGPINSLTDPDFNYRQVYTVTEVTGPTAGYTTGGTMLGNNLEMPPDRIGPRSTRPYAPLVNAAIYTHMSSGIKMFAGQRQDPFYVDVGSIFDLLGLRPFNSAHVIPLANHKGVDTTGGFNIHTTALQIPITRLVTTGCDLNDHTDQRCVIGVWSTADRPATTTRTGGSESGSGGYIQVSRLGNPLVNEVVIPLGLKDAFNSIGPAIDKTVQPAVDAVTNPETANLICILYGIDSPGLPCNNHTPGPRNAPRDDLVKVFLTGIPSSDIPGFTTQQTNSATMPSEQLRLNTSIAPNPAGVCAGNKLGILGGDLAGWPNGRRLEDDVTDEALRAVAGGYALTPSHNHSPNNALSDGVDNDDKPCRSDFPYIGSPWRGYNHRHHHTPTNLPATAPEEARVIPPLTLGVGILGMVGYSLVRRRKKE